MISSAPHLRLMTVAMRDKAPAAIVVLEKLHCSAIKTAKYSALLANSTFPNGIPATSQSAALKFTQQTSSLQILPKTV